MPEQDHEQLAAPIDVSVGIVARHEPDTLARILEIAKLPGTAPASVIVVRSGIWRAIRWQRSDDDEELRAFAVGESEIPIVIDDTIPSFPGFEIHREI